MPGLDACRMEACQIGNMSVCRAQSDEDEERGSGTGFGDGNGQQLYALVEEPLFR